MPSLDESLPLKLTGWRAFKMKQNHSALKLLLVKLCCCLCLSAALGGCGDNRNVRSRDNRSTSPTGETRDDSGSPSEQTSDDGGASPSQTSGSKAEEVCRRYESCGCQKFDECMAQIGNDPVVERAGNGDCMIKSSCQSLCANRPDGCLKTNTDAGNPATGPQRSNCSAIPCSRNSDCPSDCYGGCDGVICYSF